MTSCLNLRLGPLDFMNIGSISMHNLGGEIPALGKAY